MSKIIERVATAIREKVTLMGATDDFGTPDWETLARSAVEAMRRPTNKMLEAVYETRPYGDGGGRERRDLRTEWCQMIDEALR